MTELLKIVDRVGVPQTLDSVYFQVGKEHKEKVEEVLSQENIPQKNFDLVEKAYFEGCAEIHLSGGLRANMTDEEYTKVIQFALDNREECGTLIYDNFNACKHVESDMAALVDKFILEKETKTEYGYEDVTSTVDTQAE